MRKHVVLHKPLAALIAALVLLSTLSVFAITSFASSALPSFSTDFTEADELTKWSGDVANFTVADSKLTSSAAWKAIAFTNGGNSAPLYENVQIDVTLNQTARIAFRASDLWTDRCYVEVDFGGAVMLRNNSDENIQTADVAGLVAGTNSNVSIKIVGNKVTVSVNDSVAINAVTAPDLADSGYIGLIAPDANVSFDKFAITPLDEDGNPIEDEEQGGQDGDDQPADDLKPTVPDKDISHYFTDFDDPDELDNKWLAPAELKIEDNKLIAKAAEEGGEVVANGALLDEEYKNFEIETVLNNDARLVFRADDIVIWTANRYYVEIDFADAGNDAAIFIRSSADESVNLKLVEVPGERLTIGNATRVRVKVVGSKIQVFLGKDIEPIAEYEDEGIAVRTGYTGVMVISIPNGDRIPTEFDYYMVTELDDSGEPVKVENNTNSISSEGSTGTSSTTEPENSAVSGPADTGESASGMFIFCLIAVFGSAAAVLLMMYKKQSAE